ncbi:MAG: DMT family transporter [Candidatus Pacebacteria bacterium]|nr:DMT family transporter [Candidatus Paceibacterota bacterium]
MTWIAIAIVAHFLNATVSIIDKYIVSNTVLKPVVYTFYSGVFQVLFLLLIPFIGFSMPHINLFLLGVGTGALFILTLLIFYKALKISEASRVIPVIGASVPIFIVFLSYFILGEFLTSVQILAFAFFVVGGFLLSLKRTQEAFSLFPGFKLAILAGFLFALYYTLIKFMYLDVTFFDGFILLQIGGFLGSIILLIFKSNRVKIFSTPDTIKKSTAYLFLPAKILAAAAAIMIFYAISMEGSKVSIINSLQAFQYVFVLFFAIILSKKIPSLFHEQLNKRLLRRKIVAIVVIGAGLFLLAIG